MATITVGGKDIQLPPLNFKSIKRVWPIAQKGMEGDDLIEIMTASVEILSIAMERSDHPMTMQQLEEELVGSEIMNLRTGIIDLLVESGLMTRTQAGEAVPGEAGAASPSTETGTDSSLNSSPPVVAAAIGTE